LTRLKEEGDILKGDRVDIKKWLKGESKKQFIERLSYLTIFIAAALIFVGLLLGSFIKYTVFLAAFGSALILIGICIYIISQLIEEKKE